MAVADAAWRQANAELEALGVTDHLGAPLARLQAVAWSYADDDNWGQGLPALDAVPLAAGRPLLDGRELALSRQQLAAYLASLAGAASGLPEAEAAAGALLGGVLDQAEVLAAEVGLDRELLGGLAAAQGLAPGPLLSLAQLAALPLLQACGRAARPLLATAEEWRRGWCPVCGAWPLLAELRGEDGGRWLHCGRCGSSWRHAHLECSFCGETEHRQQGYLAVASEREARRASFCLRCGSYLKAIATPFALAPPAAALADLRTLDLDLVALERGYRRPNRPPAPPSVVVRLY